MSVPTGGPTAPGAPYAAQQPATYQAPPKSFVATWLLAWLLGGLGIDRFYLGKIGTGILKLITGGGFGIWALVDLIITLTGNQRDKLGQPLAGYEENKKTAWIVTIAVIVVVAILDIILIASGVFAASGSVSTTTY